jgi:hypothetical protein
VFCIKIFIQFLCIFGIIFNKVFQVETLIKQYEKGAPEEVRCIDETCCYVMMRFVTLSLVVIMISGFLSRRCLFKDALCISDHKASSNSVIDE